MKTKYLKQFVVGSEEIKHIKGGGDSLDDEIDSVLDAPSDQGCGTGTNTFTWTIKG